VTGAGFVQHVWRAQSKTPNKYAAPLGARLPQSTEQVMHPATHFLGTPDQPTELAFTTAPPGKLLYENTLGELEVSILLAQHLGTSTAAAGWDGDRYRVVDVGGKRVLLWQTVWDDAGAADRFANAYRAIAAKRPNRAVHVVRNDMTERPGVWVVDAPSGVDAARYGPLTVQLR
jgi:hypothetical protein